MLQNLRAAWWWSAGVFQDWPLRLPAGFARRRLPVMARRLWAAALERRFTSAPGRLRGVLDDYLRRAATIGLADGFGFSSADMSGPVEPRIRLVVSGRVQGVGFRAWVLRRALELDVRGWVKNCRDGGVEVEAAGPPSALERLRLLVSDGPPLAHVFEVREEPPHNDRLGEHFEIR